MKEIIRKNIGNILFVVFVLVFFFVPGVRETIQGLFLMKPNLEQSQDLGKLSDDDFQVKLKGINVPDANLADFKGKMLFLNFWGSWCPPCRTEFPTIQSLYKDKKDEIAFVLIAMQDKEEKVKNFLAQNQYTTPVYMLEEPLPQILDFRVFPTTFIIDKNGEIIKKDEGAADWNHPDVRAFLEELIK